MYILNGELKWGEDGEKRGSSYRLGGPHGVVYVQPNMSQVELWLGMRLHVCSVV
jgi:hypothetical protein